MAEGNKNEAIEQLKERALKITEALYRTTDIMFDGEPLKWSLRQSALEIMNIVSNLNSCQISEVNKADRIIKNVFLKLELASSGTYMSKMNFEVLKREYSVLNQNILEQSKEPILLDLPQQAGLPAHISMPVYRTKESVKDIISDKEVVSDMVEKKVFVPEPLQETKKAESDRKSIILAALEGVGPSSVSDVARVFNGTIGEKTVQRELNSLVDAGTIKKDGEKRWRRYFL